MQDPIILDSEREAIGIPIVGDRPQRTSEHFRRLLQRSASREITLSWPILSLRDRAGTYVNRGILKLRRKDFGSAQFDFNRAIETKPDLGEAYVNRGATYIGQRDYAASLPDINRGLELGVDEPAKAYYNRALAYEGLEDAKSAYYDYQKAVEINPEWAAPREQLTRFSVSRR